MASKILSKGIVRIGMLSLGCPKTLVDSEVILGKLDPQQYEIADSVADCDIALLNTCSFIQEAQQESIDRILELIELKKEKQIRALIVMGCLVQQFPHDLRKDLKEVDAFVGSGEYARIAEVVNEVSEGGKIFSVGGPGYLGNAADARVALTPVHYRYLKISEGCDHICAFCTIPLFRGKHRSRAIADVAQEAATLARAGCRELILTGQDTTYFGRDRGGQFELPSLMRQLDLIPELKWLRLLYAYPSCITTELMEAMASSRAICHYLDMPLQHASDKILLAMRRGITQRRTVDLIRKFRSYVPDIAIRTTFIVGFPGETEQDFSELLDFMKESRFERLGIFQYSQEKDSDAAQLPNQVDDETKQERFGRAMELQQEISRSNNEKWQGKTLEVIVDGIHENASGQWVGRTYMDAPEVDGTVVIHSSKPLMIGQFYPVKITETEEYDLVGRHE